MLFGLSRGGKQAKMRGGDALPTLCGSLSRHSCFAGAAVHKAATRRSASTRVRAVASGLNGALGDARARTGGRRSMPSQLEVLPLLDRITPSERIGAVTRSSTMKACSQVTTRTLSGARARERCRLPEAQRRIERAAGTSGGHSLVRRALACTS